jgi:GNAT superfamily N-acetyltransferase
MNFKQFLEATNPAVFKRGFSKIKEILGGEYTLTATPGYFKYRTEAAPVKSEQFRIECKDKKGNLVGWVNFEEKRDHSDKTDNLEAIDLVVNKEHRRKGIATEMYKFARELKNDIRPSSKQTSMGQQFWRKDHSK